MTQSARRILITGADGFVGRWLVRAALAKNYDVVAAMTADGQGPERWLTTSLHSHVTTVRGDLRDSAYLAQLAGEEFHAAIHLAAIASGPAVRQDPTLAWSINAGGSALLAEAVAQKPGVTFLLVSTGEVYGRDHTTPINESAPLAPISPYAATKVGAEVAVTEVARRTGLQVVIARPFPHTGPGQSEAFVYPALAARLRQAAVDDTSEVPVGNLAPVRDLLDVRDVVAAYLILSEQGQGGEIYNVASGHGESLATSFDRLAVLTKSAARPQVDPTLLRTADLPVLIGDATKLRKATGWAPSISLEQTFQDLVNAQAD